MSDFISYEGLPISAGGAHKINRKTPNETCQQILKFLEKFTDSREPTDLSLTLYVEKGKPFDTKHVRKVLRKKIHWFPRRNFDGLYKTFTWTLKTDDIQSYLPLLEEFDELPETSIGPLCIEANWQFHFKDPETGKNLVGQSDLPEIDFRLPNSSMRLMLGKKSTVSVWFAFPFDGNEHLLEGSYLDQISEALPFKLSDKHWRRWKKSTSGNWIPKKVEKRQLT